MATSTRHQETPSSSQREGHAEASRHRAAGRAGVLRACEVAGLWAAVACSLVAALLTAGGQRPAAIVVAAAGLVLAVAAVVAGRVDRPSRPRGRRRMSSGR